MAASGKSVEWTANLLWTILMIAPVLYLALPAAVLLGHQGLARDQSIIPNLFLGFLAVSAVNVVLVYYTQTSAGFMSRMTRISLSRDRGAFQVFSLGMIIVETFSIYGLVLTLLSGSLFYGFGFSIAAWTGLVLVRIRFKQNMADIPKK